MGGINDFIEAKTMTELKKKAQKFSREAREMGMEVAHGWNPENVQKDEDGTLRLWVHAHS